MVTVSGHFATESGAMKTGYSIRTWRMRLFCPERDMIDANITFFKGMYKDLTDTSVTLKLWNGKKWN